MVIRNNLNTELYWNIDLHDAVELIETQKGRFFPLSAVDLELMVAGVQKTINDIVHPGNNVALVLPFGNLKLLPILIYHACIACDATVMRYGTLNIERQLWLLEKTKTDIIFTSPAIWDYLRKTSFNNSYPTWIACILLNIMEIFHLNEISNAERVFIEHFEIPCCFLQKKDGLFWAPGYQCEIFSKDNQSSSNKSGELLISTNPIESFTFSQKHTGMLVEMRENEICSNGFRIIEILSNNNDEQIIERLTKILKKFQINEDQLQISDGQLKLNSLSIIDLLVGLEEEFSFRIEIEKINRSDFSTFNSILSFIKRNYGEKEKKE